jgi:formate hydrogenlyase subunit 6/NADH:ubiquinone oxidoreductase subunit I
MLIQEYGKTVCWLGRQIKSLWRVLGITAKHFYTSFRHTHRPTAVTQAAYFQEQIGALSLQYPHEKLPIPERGRYKLDNVIEDCIMCDQCVRACPVDCIEIEAIPSPTVIGKTSNGMPKRLYAAKFDIDMAKCCFCGLCTTVCPTACLTMTSEYDFSAFDFAAHKQSFATMSPQEVKEKKSAWAAYTVQQKK